MPTDRLTVLRVLSSKYNRERFENRQNRQNRQSCFHRNVRQVQKIMVIAENKSLILQTWEVADATEAFAFYGDPEVSKYIGNGKPAPDVAHVERVLRKFIGHQELFRFSPWAIVEKESSQIIGICGLHGFNEKREPELGFRVLRSKWGQGIATQASRLSVQYGFETLNLSSICARTFEKNLATQKVLEKIGFVKTGSEWVEDIGKNVFHYALVPTNYKFSQT